MRQHELEAEQERARERGELERALSPRQEVRDDRAEDEQALEHPLRGVQVGDARRVVLPQSQSEKGESRPTWHPSVRSQKTRAAWSGFGSRSSTRKRRASPRRTRRGT